LFVWAFFLLLFLAEFYLVLLCHCYYHQQALEQKYVGWKSQPGYTTEHFLKDSESTVTIGFFLSILVTRTRNEAMSLRVLYLM